MAKKTPKRPKSAAAPTAPASVPAAAADQDALSMRPAAEVRQAAEEFVHVYGNGVICETDTRGYPTRRNLNPAEIVLDASEGVIPLWARGTTLRWRFQRQSLLYFRNPQAAARALRQLMSEALAKWGDAVPVRFAERDDVWDFEVVMRPTDNCSGGGCVLASAFFPDAGRHQLRIYPAMFRQVRDEQVETLVHEFGHVFGLRHFFANVSERQFPSVVFGTHSPFTVMNYGSQSVLTDADRSDLRQLYQQVWSGSLTEVNGTPIKLMRPYSSSIPGT
jgi:hypothetical protein